MIAEVCRALGGVTIVHKGSVDLVSNGSQWEKCVDEGCPRRWVRDEKVCPWTLCYWTSLPSLCCRLTMKEVVLNLSCLPCVWGGFQDPFFCICFGGGARLCILEEYSRRKQKPGFLAKVCFTKIFAVHSLVFFFSLSLSRNLGERAQSGISFGNL